jgi:arylsulfatase A-like enzyme
MSGTRSARCLLVAAFFMIASCAEPEPSRPNLLLVSIDSLRADHLHAYGYERETSPNLDRLADEGVLFSNALSPSSWTLPSHVTLLTSIPPEAHRVRTARTRLDEAVTTLAETLRDAGYRTGAVVGGPFLRRVYGYDQGFEEYDESVVKRRKESHTGTNSPELVSRSLAWLRRWHESREREPFFLFLHLWDVHYDYTPPAPFDTLFDPDYEGSATFEDFEDNPNVKPGMDERDLEHLVALYDGEIRYTDDQLGRVLFALGKMGISDDTLVVVTADHGDEFLDHGGKGHTGRLFEEIVRVPLVIRLPGRVAPGRSIDAPMRLMDVGPTILGLLGLAAPEGYGLREGPDAARARDVSAWLRDPPPTEPFPELVALAEARVLAPNVQTSIRRGRWKLMRFQLGQRSVYRLFDLESDPGERRDAARLPANSERFSELQRELAEWETWWQRNDPGLSRATRIDRAHEEQLRALGYVE